MDIAPPRLLSAHSRCRRSSAAPIAARAIVTRVPDVSLRLPPVFGYMG